MSPDDDIAGSYVSSHAANVFLSEIRHTSLDADALDCLNTFLDEFLFAILKASGDEPLVTDHIRQGLLKTLSTSLGQATLIEAEIELRAYRDRTKNLKKKVEGKELPATWAFQLLRLKCQALSTLSDTSEESQAAAEARVKEEMREANMPTPSAGLLIPAALYLTATLEFICEHVLANVSRVVSRDSSRTNAALLDVFTALCEDNSTYEVFKTLDVYKALEGMFTRNRLRRNKSFLKGDRGARSDSTRMSSDSNVTATSTTPTLAHPASRSSFEKKSRIGNGRKSQEERRSQSRRESYLGDEGRKSLASYPDTDSYQDSSMQHEFDELMRSDATMKVSLTPDRLRNELTQKDKLESRSEPNSPTPVIQRQRSLTVIEDEEGSTTSRKLPPPRRRFSSLSPPTNPPPSSRYRKRAATFAAEPGKANKLPPSRLSIIPSSDALHKIPLIDSEDIFQTPSKAVQQTTFPSIPRLHPAEASGHSQGPGLTPNGKELARVDSFSQTRPLRSAVSAATRELIAFLDEGPPEEIFSNEEPQSLLTNRSFSDDSATPNTSRSDSPSKGVRKLQKMINKLAVGNSRRNRQDASPSTSVEEVKLRANSGFDDVTHASTTSSLNSATAITDTNLRFSLPTPPHYVSLPPSSALSRISAENSPNLGRKLSVSRKPVPLIEGSQSPPRNHSNRPPSIVSSIATPVPARWSSYVPPPDPNRVDVTLGSAFPTQPDYNTATNQEHGVHDSSLVDPSLKPHITASAARDMRRLLANATNVDECCVIFDMFMAKSGIPLTDEDPALPLTVQAAPTPGLESSMVECLLSREERAPSVQQSPPRPPRRRPVSEIAALGANNAVESVIAGSV